MDVLGKHDVDVFVALARKHGIEAIDLSGEDSHAFVFGRRTIQANAPASAPAPWRQSGAFQLL